MASDIHVVKFLKINENALIPTKADPGSVGYDVYCISDFKLDPGERRLIGTGLSSEFYGDFYLRIAPRSGLAVKGVDILAGVEDSSYRGEIKVIMINHSADTLSFKKHDRIAQFIFERVMPVLLMETNYLNESSRMGGFGSTGN